MRKFFLIVVMCGLTWQCKTGGRESDSEVKDLADGSNWCHLRLKSTDETNVSIDYTVYTDIQAGTHEAKPIWVNVTKTGFTGTEGVQAVLIEKIQENGKEREGVIEKIDLTFNGQQQKYTGELSAGMLLRGKSKNVVGQEFAFRVGSTWLKDPVSGESNFKSNLYEINRTNKFVCKNPSSPVPPPMVVKDWRALPAQAEIDQLVSHPLNDPAFPFTDYRPDAPGASADLPGLAILEAMRRGIKEFKTYRGEQSYSNLTACLQTGYAPTHWPDVAIHYYCVMNGPRYCYTYATSAQTSRVDSFKGCIDAWPNPGVFAQQNYVPAFKFVKDDQPREFQYIMFAQTNAFKSEQEQAIINEFWDVQNPYDADECRTKRPRRSEDPSDGSHCRPDKVYQTKLIGRSR